MAETSLDAGPQVSRFAKLGALPGRLGAWISRHPRTVLCSALLLFTAGLLVYSQTMAFVWDEGFHLLAAQLIKAGKVPYIDFCFPQTLLNAYMNAGIMRVFGESWYVIHVWAALAVAGSIALTADYLQRRFPDRRWALPCALAALCLVGFDTVVVGFGPSAQAYGTGMLLCVVAFRCAVRAARTGSVLSAAAAGLGAGATAGSTLLTAPVIPVFFVWLWVCGRREKRRAQVLAFALVAALPFAPEIWLLLRAPQQTFFNVVQYQALFRRVNWGDVGGHDFDVFTDWTVSVDTFLLGLLAAGGLLFIARKSGWERSLRREFYLAAWLSLGLGAYISTAHPTFGRYFVFLIPFVAILAGAGLYVAGSRLVGPNRPGWSLALIAVITSVSIAKYIFDDREGTNWHDYEAIARKIQEVTPTGAELFADEHVYFLLKRTPPSGMEFSYSHKIQLPPAQEALYHVISFAGLKKQVQAGRFYTVESCKDDVMDDFKLDDYFPNRQDFDDCAVFWKGPKVPAAKPARK